MNPMPSIKTTIVTVLVVFAGLALYTNFIGPIPFSVNSVTTTKTDLFRAEGTGTATAIPDTALLYLGVMKNAATVQEAQNQMNTAANAIVAGLKKLGIDEKHIKTINYSIYPSYDYLSVPSFDTKQKITKYTASQDIEVKITPIEKVNQAIDMATTQGANVVGGVSFMLDDSVRKQLEEKARNQAVQNAKEKAQSLARIAGIKLGKIVDVKENTSLPVTPYEGLSLVAQKDDKTTNVNPGNNSLQITITLSYQTY